MSPPSSPRRSVVFRTATGHLGVLFFTVFFGTLAVLLGWLPPRGHLFFLLARWWSRCLLWAGGVPLETSSESGLAGEGPFVVMSNHQGIADIPALLGSLPFQTRFLAKRSLFKIPLLGWGMWLGGFVPVERGNPKRARAAFDSAVDRLVSRRVSVLLFPEETRSPDGRLLPFRRGGFLLALKSGLPIVPVGIRGTHEVCPKGSLTIKPGPVRVAYGSPIEVSSYGLKGRKALEARVRQRILELSGVDDSVDKGSDPERQ